jgi:hypothetical protein
VTEHIRPVANAYRPEFIVVAHPKTESAVLDVQSQAAAPRLAATRCINA